MQDVQGIRRRLRRAMGESGFSIRKLSKAIREQTKNASGKPARGSSYTSLRDFIHGAVDEPRPNILEEAAKALGVSSDWLINGEGAATEFDRHVVELSAKLVGDSDMRANLKAGKDEGRGKVTLPGLGAKGTGTVQSEGDAERTDGEQAAADKRRAARMFHSLESSIRESLGHECPPYMMSILANVLLTRADSVLTMLSNELDDMKHQRRTGRATSVDRVPRHYMDWNMPDGDTLREHVAEELGRAFRAPFEALGIDPGDLSDEFIADYVYSMAAIMFKLARIRPAGDDAGDDVRINYRGGRVGSADEYRLGGREADPRDTDPRRKGPDEKVPLHQQASYRGHTLNLFLRGEEWWVSVDDEPWTRLRAVAGDASADAEQARQDAMAWFDAGANTEERSDEDRKREIEVMLDVAGRAAKLDAADSDE